MTGLIETLEAEVRSKFQTHKQMEFSSKGIPVEVLFDETIVKYNWVEERKFHIVNIILVKEDRSRAEELMKLQEAQSIEDGEENADGDE